MSHEFSCTGCGACCKGRFIPLTLGEARAWASRGHTVAIMLEAFDDHAGMAPGPLEHARRRAASVRCGASNVYVIVILAAQAIPVCPNLGTDDLCQIYDHRPLVCRIYPQEINPFIPLDPGNKDCPEEAWQQGGLLGTDRPTRGFVEASRQADRDDAEQKVQLCAELGFTVCGWKGDGLTIYTPAIDKLHAAFEQLSETGISLDTNAWEIQVSNNDLHPSLESRSLRLFKGAALPRHQFHAL